MVRFSPRQRAMISILMMALSAIILAGCPSESSEGGDPSCMGAICWSWNVSQTSSSSSSSTSSSGTTTTSHASSSGASMKPIVVCLAGHCGISGTGGSGGMTGSGGAAGSAGFGGSTTTTTTTTTGAGGTGGSGGNGTGGMPGAGGDTTTTTTTTTGAGGTGGSGGNGTGGMPGAGGDTTTTTTTTTGAGGTGGSGGNGTGAGGSVAVGGGDPADAGVPIDPDAGTPPADDAGDGSVPADPDAGTDAGGPPVCQPPVVGALLTCQQCTVVSNATQPSLDDLKVVNFGKALPNGDLLLGGNAYADGAVLLRLHAGIVSGESIPAANDLKNAYAFSDGTVYVVGQGAFPSFGRFMMKYVAGSWITIQNAPAVGLWGYLVDVWGQTPAESFILVQKETGQMEIRHGSEATGWQLMQLPPDIVPLQIVPAKIWGTSSSDIYVVGYEVDGAGNPIYGVLLHYNGTSWLHLPTPANVDMFTTINGTSPCNVLVGGRMNTGFQEQGMTMSFNGNAWSAPVAHNVDIVLQVAVRTDGQAFAVGSKIPSQQNVQEFWISGSLLSGPAMWAPATFPQSVIPTGLAIVPQTDHVFIFGASGGAQVAEQVWN